MELRTRAQLLSEAAEDAWYQVFLQEILDLNVAWVRILDVARKAGISDGAIRIGCAANLTHYQRWLDGKTSPSQALRPALIEIIKNLLDLYRRERDRKAL